MPKPALSISDELHATLEVLRGVILLCQQIATQHLTGREVMRGVRSAGATLVMLRDRIALLDQVVRRVVDPRALITDDNRAHLDSANDDVHLVAWHGNQVIQHLRGELERAELRARVKNAKEPRSRASSRVEVSAKAEAGRARTGRATRPRAPPRA